MNLNLCIIRKNVLIFKRIWLCQPDCLSEQKEGLYKKKKLNPSWYVLGSLSLFFIILDIRTPLNSSLLIYIQLYYINHFFFFFIILYRTPHTCNYPTINILSSLKQSQKTYFLLMCLKSCGVYFYVGFINIIMARTVKKKKKSWETNTRRKHHYLLYSLVEPTNFNGQPTLLSLLGCCTLLNSIFFAI